jgi:hypothetical protein
MAASRVSASRCRCKSAPSSGWPPVLAVFIVSVWASANSFRSRLRFAASSGVRTFVLMPGNMACSPASGNPASRLARKAVTIHTDPLPKPQANMVNPAHSTSAGIPAARRTKRVAPALALLVGLTGCAIERTPHLYPANDIAQKTGVLSGSWVGHGHLHGTAELTMPDGEILQGEYSIVTGGSIGFGNIFSTVYGSRGFASGIGTVSGSSISAGGEGSASLYGSKGTSMQCEFRNNNMTGHGYGACQSSIGGLYRMQY